MSTAKYLRVNSFDDVHFLSDLHLNHKNIVRGTSKWKDKTHCRDFNTCEEMEELIVTNINNSVKETDHLFLLGDLSLSGSSVEDVLRFLDKINCKNVYLILGNHDDVLLKSSELKSKFKLISEYTYLKVINKENVTVPIVLQHYPIYSWRNMGHSSLHLFGHVHMPLDYYKEASYKLAWMGKYLDVGCESLDFKPISLTDVKKILDPQPIRNLILPQKDHHFV